MRFIVGHRLADGIGNSAGPFRTISSQHSYDSGVSALGFVSRCWDCGPAFISSIGGYRTFKTQLPTTLITAFTPRTHSSCPLLIIITLQTVATPSWIFSCSRHGLLVSWPRRPVKKANPKLQSAMAKLVGCGSVHSLMCKLIPNG